MWSRVSTRTLSLLAGTAIIFAFAVITERLGVRLRWDTRLDFYGALYGNALGLFGLLTSASYAFDLEASARREAEAERRMAALVVTSALVTQFFHSVELFAAFFVAWSDGHHPDVSASLDRARIDTILAMTFELHPLVTSRFELLPDGVVTDYLHAAGQVSLMSSALRGAYDRHEAGGPLAHDEIRQAAVFLFKSVAMLENAIRQEIGEQSEIPTLGNEILARLRSFRNEALSAR